jgi:preprotein translocase subunit SecE
MVCGVLKVNTMSSQPVKTVNDFSDKLKVALAIVAVIAGVVGFFVLSGRSTVVRASALIGGLLIMIGFFWTSTQGRSLVSFAKESVREAKKVVWPTRKEAMQITAVVFAFVLVMALFLWGVDKLLEFLLYDVILSWK